MFVFSPMEKCPAMNASTPAVYIRLISALSALALLASCTPATTGLSSSDTLQRQLNSLRAEQQQQATQLKEIRQQLAEMQQQLAQNPASTQDLLSGAERSPAPTSATKVPPQRPQRQVVSAEASAVAASASAYLAAFSDLAAGHWAAAETGFQNFLNEYSEHPYSPNARYWLASAQLSQGKAEAALGNLQQVVVDPAGRSKAPAALNQMARVYRDYGMTARADQVIEQLRNNFPESPEAQYSYRDNTIND